MCLAIPGKVLEITHEHGLRMGRIDFSGTIQSVCLESVADVSVGQYVLVHAGFALNVIDETEARRTLDLWDDIVARSAERGEDPFGHPLEPDAGERQP